MNKIKYILTLIIGLVILSPGVNAECINLLPEGEMKWYIDSNGYYISLDGTSVFLNSVLNPGTTYTLYATKDGSLVESIVLPTTYQFIITNAKDVSPIGFLFGSSASSYDLSHFIFTPKNRDINIRYAIPTDSDLAEMATWQFWIVEGSEVCLNDTEPEEPETPVDPEEPTEPEYPDISETDQGKILSNFYSIYLDRLGFVSEYFANNTLFLAFIGVIILFIILEIFLKLYRGGGYR